MTKQFENNCENENVKSKSYGGQKNHKHKIYDHKDNCECEQKFKNEQCECGCENIELKSDHKEDCREEEFKETLQRLQAEFDNYRKRTDANMIKVKEDGVVYAINKLLPVLDSFKSAKMLVKNEEFLNSLNLVEKQFIEGLNALNITKIEADNQIFNPRYHNAVMTGWDETKKDDEILEVFQDGYMLGERVIRHSVVKINKMP